MSAPSSALDWQRRAAAGEFTYSAGIALTLEALRRVQAADSPLTEILEASAREAASAADRRRADGVPARPLEGVPITIKDNIATVEGTTTAASAILDGYSAPEDATVVARLREAGAIVVAKTNCDEFAMGASTETSARGPTRNPWDPTRVPGGSSGGAAVVAATVEGGIHVGSDTGGSVRQPAALCGVSGFKPTYGSVSRAGLIAFASSLDQVGFLARSATDLRAAWEVVAGRDPRDPATEAIDAPSPSSGEPRVIGLLREWTGDDVAPAVRERVSEAARSFEELGFEVREISVPLLPIANACYHVISAAEAASNLARYDGVRCGAERGTRTLGEHRSAGFGREVQRRLVMGAFVTSTGQRDRYYARAVEVRRALAAQVRSAWSEVDLLLAPTTPTTAFRLGENLDDPIAMYAGDRAAVAANLLGLPALSLPAGRDAGGLPVGVQLVAPRHGDRALFHCAERFQSATTYHLESPSGASREESA